MKTVKLITICMFALATVAYSQKPKVISGNVKILKGEKEINLQYDYSNMKVGGLDEADYLDQKAADREKKKPGSGEKFKQEWVNNRATRFEPKFEELLNKNLGDADVKAGKDMKAAKYTLILKTTYTEPGYNIGISRKPAFLNYEIQIVETENSGNVVCKFTLTNVPGQDAMGNDYDTGGRLAEGYAKCGKVIGKYLTENAFKK